MIRGLLSIYSPTYPKALVYMLQACEYRAEPYLAWFHRTKNFNQVMKRRQLDKTKAARLILLLLYGGMLVEILAGVFLIYLGIWHHLAGGIYFGAALIVAYPIAWAYLAIIAIELGRSLIVTPKEKRLIAESERQFARHKGIKIAIAGSYGKTSMKELLQQVLSSGKQVAATPANKNVPVSHAQFARSLSGKEDIVLIEFGEGAPGDIARFCRTTHPTHAVITGLAPAHLDQYKNLKAAGEDIFSVTDFVEANQIYVNAESMAAREFIKPEFKQYSEIGALDWAVHDVKVSIDGLKFKLSHGKHKLTLESGLIGRHQLGPLSLAVALAKQFGLTDAEIIKAVAATKPYEHRLQPYSLNGAWIIDDTYNGNIEGIRAGTILLAELPAKRKLYVTPGLVDQGEETEKVHQEMGRLIAASSADVVILMKNSVTTYIQEGLKSAQYGGEVRLETDPLAFYSNLGEFVAAGDLVLMQNDWTDNYA